jgi:hypothetical protein
MSFGRTRLFRWILVVHADSQSFPQVPATGLVELFDARLLTSELAAKGSPHLKCGKPRTDNLDRLDWAEQRNPIP